MIKYTTKKREKSSSYIKNMAFILLFISMIILCVETTGLILVDNIKVYDIGINVDNIAGFNISSSEHFLQFGTSCPGSVVTRELMLNNTETKQKKVIIKSYGEMKDWITLSENNFLLNKHENRTIKVYVRIPDSTEYGNYSGKMKLYFIRVF